MTVNDYIRLVAWLREHGKKNARCHYCPYYDAFKRGYSTCSEELAEKAADAIEELSRAVETVNGAHNDGYDVGYWAGRRDYEPKWIPVTERLPVKKCETYWICTDIGEQCECRWTNNRFGIGESDEWGWSIFDVPQYQKVVGWMQLPSPYKPPKEED